MANRAKYAGLVLAAIFVAGSAGRATFADALLHRDEGNQQTGSGEPTDAEIRDLLVKESITRYTGPCACPYHRQWNEKLFRFPNDYRDRPTIRCGRESEYLRPGGPTVFCYGSDVPAELVEAYRERLRSTFLTEPKPDF